MRAVFVVVANILREQAFQVAFVNCDHVIQEITPTTPYPTLCDSILPRTLERGADRTRPRTMCFLASPVWSNRSCACELARLGPCGSIPMERLGRSLMTLREQDSVTVTTTMVMRPTLRQLVETPCHYRRHSRNETPHQRMFRQLSLASSFILERVSGPIPQVPSRSQVVRASQIRSKRADGF